MKEYPTIPERTRYEIPSCNFSINKLPYLDDSMKSLNFTIASLLVRNLDDRKGSKCTEHD